MNYKNIKWPILLLGCALTLPAFADYPIALQDKFIATQDRTKIYLPVLKNDSGLNLRITRSNNWTVKGGRTKPVRWGGTFTTRNRQIEYTIPKNFVGNDEFWYVMKDDKGRANAAKVIVNVLPAYSKPVQDDKVTVQKNTAYIEIDVLANDLKEVDYTTPNIDRFNEWSEKGGRIITGGDNKLRYTPRRGFVGTDTFWYAAEFYTGGRGTHAAKVTVEVTENYAGGPYPTSKPDRITVPAGGVNMQYHPLDNDIGKDLTILTGRPAYAGNWSKRGVRYIIDSNGPNGGDNAIFYNPPRELSGEDKIWYTFQDNLGRRNFGEVTFLLDSD